MIARHVGACPRRTVFTTRGENQKHLSRPPDAAEGGVGRAGNSGALKTCLVSNMAPRGQAPPVAENHGNSAVLDLRELDRFQFEAFTHECPHGIVGEKMCDVTFDEILDVQLTLYEVMIRAALEGR